MMGAFTDRRAVVAAAKADLFRDWFIVVRFTDNTWDYARPGHPLPSDGRAEEIAYLRSRTSGAWYCKR